MTGQDRPAAVGVHQDGGQPTATATTAAGRKPRPPANPARWHRLVQYRWTCECCAETHMVAVVPYYGRQLRLCQTCYADGFWKGSL